jgi:hypothetical protein
MGTTPPTQGDYGKIIFTPELPEVVVGEWKTLKELQVSVSS